jgi:predicted regulator of Ras-like GTPase activity (Roadblock/LC7/MglB family)
VIGALTEEEYLKIEQIVSDLLVQVEADAVMLCDRGGNIIAQQSVSTYEDEDNIAALASGAFFATVEMARLVGESEFRSMLHQGERMSIYMEGTVGDMLLVIVFDKFSNPGLVKLYARKASEQLGEQSLCVDQMGAGGIGAVEKLELDENAQPFMFTNPSEE